MGNDCLAIGFAGLLIAAAASAAQPARDALIVLNKEQATLVIVDPSSGEILGRVPTGEGPHEVAVSADGRTAFVGNYGAQAPGSTLSIIDLAARKELRRVDLGPLRRPHGMAAAGSRVYFTAETNRLIGRYDPASNQVDWLLGTGQAGTHMVWVNRDETTIVTANIGSDSVTVMQRGDSPLAWNQTVVQVGKGPEGFDVSPDGRELWAAHSRDGGVSIVDLAAKKVVQTIDAGTKRSNRLKFTPDGRLALVSDLDAGELVVLDVAARTVAKRVPLGKMPEGILVAPDGSTAYVAVNGDDHIAVVDLKTLHVVRKLTTGDGPDGMAWAPRAYANQPPLW
jgi:YVTN family beta-propeller protein